MQDAPTSRLQRIASHGGLGSGFLVHDSMQSRVVFEGRTWRHLGRLLCSNAKTRLGF